MAGRLVRRLKIELDRANCKGDGTAGGSNRGRIPRQHGHAATSHACQGSRVLGVSVSPPTCALRPPPTEQAGVFR